MMAAYELVFVPPQTIHLSLVERVRARTIRPLGGKC